MLLTTDGGRSDMPAPAGKGRGKLTTEEAVPTFRETEVVPVELSLRIASALLENLNRVVKGAQSACEIATTAVLAAGHLLIEDVPGVGKTMLAKAVAASIGARLARIQGHPDLLPSDITGVSVYNQASDTWQFRRGPVFANVVLFDELNRTPPRSQAALLEAMEERQVSVDSESFELPVPHLVLATQNPVDQAGTYPLVESQMDRFLLATRLGYPDAKTEAALAVGHGAEAALSDLEPICTPEELSHTQRVVAGLPVHEAVADYAVAIARSTRESAEVRLGASPRATIALLSAARAHAVVKGRPHVLPDDVKAVALPVLAHRVVTDASGVGAFDTAAAVVASLLENVPSPRP